MKGITAQRPKNSNNFAIVFLNDIPREFQNKFHAHIFKQSQLQFNLHQFSIMEGVAEIL